MHTASSQMLPCEQVRFPFIKQYLNYIMPWARKRVGPWDIERTLFRTIVQWVSQGPI